VSRRKSTGWGWGYFKWTFWIFICYYRYTRLSVYSLCSIHQTGLPEKGVEKRMVADIGPY